MTFTPSRRQPLSPKRRSPTRPRRARWLAPVSLGLGLVLGAPPGLAGAATERPATPLPAVRVQPDGTGESKTPTPTPTRGPAASEPVRRDDRDKFKIATQTAAPAAGSAKVEAPAQDKSHQATGAHVMLYLVDSGDTLSSIAEKFGLKLSTILWNNWIPDPNRIVVGQAIVLPSTDAAIHVVRPGETLNDVAARYETRLETVATFNRIDDPATLATGAQLLVPVSRYPDHELLSDLEVGAPGHNTTSPLYLGDSVQMGLRDSANQQTVLPRVRLRAEVPFQVVIGPDAPAMPATRERAAGSELLAASVTAETPAETPAPAADAPEPTGEVVDRTAAEDSEAEPVTAAAEATSGEPAAAEETTPPPGSEAAANPSEQSAPDGDSPALEPTPAPRLTDDSVATIGPERPAAIPTPEPAPAPRPADAPPAETNAATAAAQASAESAPRPGSAAITIPASVPSEAAVPAPEPPRQAAEATPAASEPAAAPPTITPTMPPATATPTIVPPTATPTAAPATTTPVPATTERTAPGENSGRRSDSNQPADTSTPVSSGTPAGASGGRTDTNSATATPTASGSRSRGGAAPSVTATATGSEATSGARSSAAAGPDAPPAGQIGVALIGEALKHVGKPYVWGGNGPNSFDCSGFTRYVYAQVGIAIPRDLSGQLRAGPSVARGDLQAGDLVFFSNTYTAGLSHNGIYIGGGKFVHAQSERVGVTITAMSDPYWSSRYTGASRPGRR